MGLPLTLYLISLTGSISCGASLICFVSLVCLSVCVMIRLHMISDNWDEERKGNNAALKFFLWASISSFIIASLVPSEKTAYTMLAAYGAENVINNEDVKRLSGKALELIEKTIDQYREKEEEEK